MIRAEKREWSEEARAGLADTFYGHGDLIETGVKAGRMELWRVNDDSWLVTERMGELLFVWCYQGKGLIAIIGALRGVAKENGHKYLAFFTRHRAAIRALRRFNPVAEPTLIDGETLYKIEAA